MTCLDLSFNDDMHDASTAALAALLATNPNVRKASIRITGITAGGALRLLACMSDSDPWRCMDMASHCHTIAHSKRMLTWHLPMLTWQMLVTRMWRLWVMHDHCA